MLNWVDPDTKEDGASSVVEETAVVTCETGEVTGDDVVNPSTIDEPTPDADENEENSSDKEEEKESGKEKEPGEEDKEPGEEHKELGEGVELETHCSRCPCYPNQCPLRRLLHSQHSPPAQSPLDIVMLLRWE